MKLEKQNGSSAPVSTWILKKNDRNRDRIDRNKEYLRFSIKFIILLFDEDQVIVLAERDDYLDIMFNTKAKEYLVVGQEGRWDLDLATLIV